MYVLVVNRTRPGLSPEELETLGRLARDFYGAPPPGVRLLGDWAAVDGSATYAILEVEGRERLEALQEPFRPYVAMETIEVRPLSGWGG
ncbi:MAG: hypothetical protein D6739_00675 [Nitrospirae bacterium]|nr:MAG: hypothetical protein D6739_00675 [Nitrospirota bacterium]